jgi:hypothetical protein
MSNKNQDLAILDAPATAPATDAPVTDAPQAPAQAPAAAPTINFVEGKEYTVKITGFNFVREYVSLTGRIGSQRISGIVGTREQYPIHVIKAYGGLDLILTFRGTGFSANGTEYNRFQITGIEGLKEA